MKEHPVYTGYLVTEDGRVFSAKNIKKNKEEKEFSYYLDYNNLKELKKTTDSSGYNKVNVYLDGKQITKSVHRMVAETFIENPNNFSHINHIDENKKNNHITNLEWTTPQKNKEHSASKFYVIENIETGEKITIYNLKKWCRENKFHESALLGTLSGKRNHSGGHRIIEKRERE